MEETIYQYKESKTRSKIILFNLDGTIFDSSEAILESFEQAYTAFNKAMPSADSIKALVGLPLELMFVKLGVDESETMDYVKVYQEHYRSIHTEKTVLMPRAKEAIELAYAQGKLGVVTTKTSEYSRILLEHFDLMKYFDIVIGREDVTNPKPNPEPILKALDILGYRFGKVTYMVGDTIADLIAAEESDIAGIGVLTGHMSKDELDEYADFIANDIYDAIKIIDKI